MTEAIAVTSFEEFLASESRSEVRHELVGGRVYVMAGRGERHDLAAQAVSEDRDPRRDRPLGLEGPRPR